MIRTLIMDVDGTLTDGKLYIGCNGELFKAFSIKDGFGISILLKRYNIIPIIITGRESKIVETRCKELSIEHLYQGVVDKLAKLKCIASEMCLLVNEIAYFGDDDNDLECMNYVLSNNGMAGCPKNSSKKVLNLPSIYRCQSNGGDGAVREYIEYIISQTFR